MVASRLFEEFVWPEDSAAVMSPHCPTATTQFLDCFHYIIFYPLFRRRAAAVEKLLCRGERPAELSTWSRAAAAAHRTDNVVNNERESFLLRNPAARRPGRYLMQLSENCPGSEADSPSRSRPRTGPGGPPPSPPHSGGRLKKQCWANVEAIFIELQLT